MKFNKYILIAIVLLISIKYSAQNASKTAEKRRQSVMEYVNNFFSEDTSNIFVFVYYLLKI